MVGLAAALEAVAWLLCRLDVQHSHSSCCVHGHLSNPNDLRLAAVQQWAQRPKDGLHQKIIFPHHKGQCPPPQNVIYRIYIRMLYIRMLYVRMLCMRMLYMYVRMLYIVYIYIRMLYIRMFVYEYIIMQYNVATEKYSTLN